MQVIICPFSRNLDHEKVNAKNYPWWKEVCTSLKSKGVTVIQVGVTGEPEIGADRQVMDASFAKLQELLKESDSFASGDNFFHHFARYYQKRGVVVWGPSDPLIFGYSTHINLLKDRSLLRPDQFGVWSVCDFDEKRFVSPDTVVDAIMEIIQGHNAS